VAARKFLGCLLLAALAPVAYAQDAPAPTASGESAEKEACRQEEQAQGSGPVGAKLKCAVKSVFQSRIRRKPDEDQVEMTVGSPPMHVEDTDTPGDGTWEINIGSESEWDGRERAIEAPTADINYGIGDRLQLTYEVPYVWLHDDGDDDEPATSAHGVGDSTLGLKYRFYDNEDRGISLALYPQLRAHTPGGNRDVSEGDTTFILPLIMVSEFEHFSVSADLGVEASSDEKRWFGGAGVGWRESDRTALMVELSGEDLNSAERRWQAGFGLRRKLHEGRSLSASIGRDVHAGAGEGLHNHFSLAYSMEFGGK
jgi:hypothetical protein